MAARLNNRFTFGANNGNMGSSNTAQDKPKAKFWLNVGYETGDAKYPFVSLPLGIPLDMSDANELRGSNEYVNFLSAQNSLLEQIIEQANTLAPGEDRIFAAGDSGLAFQIRHVRGEVEATPADQNTLARPNLFAPAAPAEPVEG